MKVVPLRDRIVIKKDSPKEKTEGGIILPDTVKEQGDTGVVIAAGPGQTTRDGILNPTTLKEGDRVLFPKFCGTCLKDLEEGLFVVSESEILCKLESE